MKAGLQYAANNVKETSLLDKLDLRTKTLVGLIVVLMAAIIPLFIKSKRYRVFQLLLNFRCLRPLVWYFPFVVCPCWVHVRRCQHVGITNSHHHVDYRIHLSTIW